VTIRLRAHHLLCMLTYIGRGYSPGFTDNYDRIADRLNTGEAIELVAGPDDICAPLLCSEKPHCHNDSVLRRDEHAATAIGDLLGRAMTVGQRLWLTADLLAQLRAAFADHAITQACQGCQWSDLCRTVAKGGFEGARIVMSEHIDVL
jgi:hypothetical protein